MPLSGRPKLEDWTPTYVDGRGSEVLVQEPAVLEVLAHLGHRMSLRGLDLHEAAEHAQHSRRKVPKVLGSASAVALLPFDEFIENRVRNVRLFPGKLGGEQYDEHDGQLPHIAACLDVVALQEDCFPHFRWT